MTEALRYPSTARNREPILAVLRTHLPRAGLVLEIASGSGEHGLFFARAFPDLRWRPSDPEPAALASIEAWRRMNGPPNLLAPAALDAASPEWPIGSADAIVCINMIHIAPWAATLGLMAGAGRILPTGGVLYLYGPYREAGVETTPSNEAFDQSLKSRDPAWGLRDLEAVAAEASRQGLSVVDRIEMPSNNLSLVFRKA